MSVLIASKTRDLGGFSVKRILPSENQRMVGPFVFFDHMGPAHFEAGNGINVRPHPHIGLATMTYLFKGSILHRDSLGSIQEIHPGDVNWMTAGRGIVHSERETLEVRGNDHHLDGIQCWMVLPEEKAEVEPSFTHVPKTQLPYIHREKFLIRLIAGEAFGRSSPVKTYSPMFYLDVIGEVGGKLGRPCGDFETAIYIQMGQVRIGQEEFKAGDFVVYESGDEELEVLTNCRILMLGGKSFEQAPFMDWNFVSFDKEKIKDAKIRWQKGEFPAIPGDDEEFIPLPG
ncbi:pirin family protein [Pleionea sediminis]|uniref:pirin family protein n=1 Tax=Pleionea sediminis TaxID=2569479 RepID=UPI001184F979|nr:pirin family protein [Pleionea sediminis]